ncbi:MAG: Membrane-associated zinc metalloprotease [Candidatus Woesebacteria bacterium GW2011_GWF2_46_8]|uniref:Membrane-associated zinc metalloprotease n=1 Tax=Candidatus Woesebacteria bacterium GW2011_GWF2_46_8 TaxID=1618604 RepID=A0A0G1QQ74_9BACT|nr:MAG: Membrane-associated zinc metalloprotease [Candidatus Woesebacteria bacterium GW2011_GWF2_46_8]
MIGSILVFLLVLSILVLIHELGHFVVARKNGVLVEEFGFGIPPRIFSIQAGETLYSLNLLPFGGSDEGVSHPDRAFLNKSKKVRISILVAGVLMNFILAIFAFAVVYSFSGIPKDTGQVKVVEVTSGSPAQVSGIIVGDIVKVVEGKSVTKVSEFVELVEAKKGSRVGIEIERNGEVKKLTLTPRESPPEGEGPLGVTITATEIYYPPALARPFVGIYYGFKEALFWGGTVIAGLIKIITDLFAGQAPRDLAGPVGIFAITSEAARLGVLPLINFLGILSVNLAILNIIPFPALDGGRLLFVFIEGILGRKVVPKVEAVIHTIGMIILILLILAITARDIQRLITAGGISGFLNSVLSR